MFPGWSCCSEPTPAALTRLSVGGLEEVPLFFTLVLLKMSFNSPPLFKLAMINRYSSRINKAFVETPHGIDSM